MDGKPGGWGGRIGTGCVQGKLKGNRLSCFRRGLFLPNKPKTRRWYLAKYAMNRSQELAPAYLYCQTCIRIQPTAIPSSPRLQILFQMSHIPGTKVSHPSAHRCDDPSGLPSDREGSNLGCAPRDTLSPNTEPAAARNMAMGFSTKSGQ